MRGRASAWPLSRPHSKREAAIPDLPSWIYILDQSDPLLDQPSIRTNDGMHLSIKEKTNMAAIRAVLSIVAFSLVLSAAPQTKEETAREIEGMLIAPCCWSQPVSQHYSEAADQIRKETRQMLAAGKSKQEILDNFAARYGERILASPKPHGFNLLAYILPFAFLVTGLGVIAFFLRKWTRRPAAAPAAGGAPTYLDDQYSARIESELRDLE